MKILIKFHVLILLVISQLSIHAQNTNILPDTPEGQIVSAYFDAFNSDDEADYRTFITISDCHLMFKKSRLKNG